MPDGVAVVLDRRRTAPVGDHGTLINIVSWILLVTVVCALIARFAMKLSIKNKKKRWGLDDIFIAIAALCSIGHTIAVSIESIQALGQHVTDLDPNQITIFQKAEYASCILYIANMGCARISLCLLIKKVLPGTTATCTALVFAGFTVLWTISGVLVTSFPCSLPNPWQFVIGKKCIDLIKWVNYVGITNIVVEVLLAMIPLFIWNLRLSAGRRVSLSCVFLARLSIVAAVSVQLSFFNRTAITWDYTYDYWPTVLCIQIAQNLSIITACLPYLHPFIINILAGTARTETISFECQGTRKLKQYIHKKTGKGSFDPMSSQSSRIPIKEPTHYCRPLATYGLDRSSAHLNSQHFNRFPSNVATPIEGPDPPENVFMRSVDIPASHPGTAKSKDLSPVPKNLSEVGVLPIIDWDTESSDQDSGRSSPSRRPNSEYVFNRAKVISVPENHLYEDGQYSKKYYPPLPSPKMPKKPPGT